MKRSVVVLFLFLTLWAKSQDKIEWQAIDIALDSDATIRKFLVNKRVFVWEAGSDEMTRIAQAQDSFYNSLDAQRKIIYNLYCPGQYSQNCVMPAPTDSHQKYIYANLNLVDAEAEYSGKQKAFIRDNRKMITAKLNLYLIDHELSPLMIFLVMRNDLYECFPALISAYKRQTTRKSYLNLTILYVMINEEEFPQKKQTVTYKHFAKKDYDKKQLPNAYIVIEVLKLSQEYFIFKMQNEAE